MVAESGKAKNTNDSQGGYKSGESSEKREDSDWRLSRWRKFFLGLNLFWGISAALYTLCQLCITSRPSDPCWTYVALGLVLASINTLPVILRKWLSHHKRLVDRSEVEAMIVEAETVERPTDEAKYDEKIYEKREQNIREEIGRLIEKTFREWTEYQVLSLGQMIVEFLKKDELKARSDSLLDDLKDYAAEPAISYDRELYEQWKDRVKKAEKKLDGNPGAMKAVLKEIQEHLADYTSFWADGSVIVDAINLCGALSIFVLLLMGTLPLLHPGASSIQFYNWGFLGTLGAVAGVLRSLHKSDLVEVGNTLGRQELQRGVRGAAIGFTAGILLYAAIAGGLISERSWIFPELPIREGATRDYYLSIFWPIISGLFFRSLFDRLSFESGLNGGTR